MIDFKSFLPKKNQSSEDAPTQVGVSLDWLQKKKAGEVPFKKATPYALVTLIALMLADLTGLSFRSSMIPKSAPPGRRPSQEFTPYKPRADYNDILARNIFNSDGIIPDLKTDGQGQIADITGPAKESQLPLTLIGTIVHINPGKSVATLEVKGNADKILPYIPNDDIEGMATLIKVARKKVFLRNLSSGALEYVQIKDDSNLAFSKKTPVVQDGPIMKEAPDTFAITRSDLETQMNNLPELLTQARALPNQVGGKIDGFKIVEIQDGSLFSKLGIQQNDIIKNVDGENLDSPAKAMELYNALKNKQQVQITVDRNGKTITQTYNIR